MAGLATSWHQSWWRHNWKSAHVVNSHLVCDLTIQQLGFDLRRQQWSLLNRFRMEQGHCGACRWKWRRTDTNLCPCGETQMMSHIVESCPLTKLNGGLSRLHSADEDAISWLTSYCSWHAYEKKKSVIFVCWCLGLSYIVTGMLAVSPGRRVLSVSSLMIITLTPSSDCIVVVAEPLREFVRFI